MFIKELETADKEVQLIMPDVDRDAQLGVTWLKGAQGRETLSLMGVSSQDNHESSLEQEKARVQEFLTGKDNYHWMISHKGKVIGAVWADMQPTKHIGAPAVSVMIGDPAGRSRGVGKAAVAAVVSFLVATSHPKIYARHLLGNQASRAMLSRLGFIPDGLPYSNDGLEWQNAVYSKELIRVGRFLDNQGRLGNWPSKAADKLAAVEYMATKFGFVQSYSEQKVNDVLKAWHTFNDWPLLRRELFENGFMKRNRDGSNYERIK